MSSSCPDCGCKVYDGKCTNCHEESYIFEQNLSNDKPIDFSENFMSKVKEQSTKSKKWNGKDWI